MNNFKELVLIVLQNAHEKHILQKTREEINILRDAWSTIE